MEMVKNLSYNERKGGREMFEELVKKRRSIRVFTDEPVSDEDLETILKTGLSAPSAKNRKPVELIVIRDREMLKKLSEMKARGGEFLAGADVAIAVVADKKAAEATYVEDASIVASFIQLQVTDLGLGSCWGNVLGSKHADGRPSGEVVRELLRLPENYEAVAVIGIGHIGKEPSKKKEDDWKKKVHREHM